MPETTTVHEHSIIMFTGHTISITFDSLRVPTTTINLVTRKREVEVEPTYQPITRLSDLADYFRKRLSVETELCRFARGSILGSIRGPDWGSDWGSRFLWVTQSKGYK